jgi:hypothetical protein
MSPRFGRRTHLGAGGPREVGDERQGREHAVDAARDAVRLLERRARRQEDVDDDRALVHRRQEAGRGRARREHAETPASSTAPTLSTGWCTTRRSTRPYAADSRPPGGFADVRAFRGAVATSGTSVSANTSDSTTAIDSVTARAPKNAPTTPGISASGANTTTVVAVVPTAAAAGRQQRRRRPEHPPNHGTPHLDTSALGLLPHSLPVLGDSFAPSFLLTGGSERHPRAPRAAEQSTRPRPPPDRRRQAGSVDLPAGGSGTAAERPGLAG